MNLGEDMERRIENILNSLEKSKFRSSFKLGLKDIKYVEQKGMNTIVSHAKDFVARRWYMNALKYSFPIEKCDFYGIADERNIGKETWYLSDVGIKQVMKEFINIGIQTLEGELKIK